MSELKTGPQLKLDRANKHLADLQNVINAWKSRKPFEVYFDPVGDGESKHSKIRVKEPLPPELAAIMGDSIHSLRSALDLVTCELAKKNGATSRSALRETYFPISASQEIFEKGTVNSNGVWSNPGINKIKRLSDEDKERIKALRPYKGGNENLWHLHQLDILDKHISLVATVGKLVTYTGPSAIQPTNHDRIFVFEPTPETKELVSGAILDKHHINDVESDIYHNYAVDIVFEGGELDGQPMLKTLFEIGNTAFQAVSDLSK